MRKLLLLAALLIAGTVDAQTYEWAFNVGGGGLWENKGRSIATDIFGNVYATGSFYGTADFDPGPGIANLTAQGGDEDIYVAKYDSIGNYLWAFALVNMDRNIGYDIVTDTVGGVGVYVTGFFRDIIDFDPGPATANLIANDTPKDRLVARGYGESKLLVENAQTEEEHQRNRRTAFRTLSEDYMPAKKFKRIPRGSNIFLKR